MALITVQIPDGGVNVFGLEYAGGIEVSVAPARAQILVEAGATIVHDVLGELSGTSTEGEGGVMTTADLQPEAPEDAPVEDAPEEIAETPEGDDGEGDTEAPAEEPEAVEEPAAEERKGFFGKKG